MPNTHLCASFRDPSGFLYRHEGTLLRQVNAVYAEDYTTLMDSELYEILTRKELLVPHEEASLDLASNPEAYKVLKPEVIPFISYPYEWCFSQLKDAALLTLRIQKIALKKGMVLKDASAYNIQFRGCKPVFIDTLSFTRYHEGDPWVAYRQFCQHFLAPLALMSYRDVRLAHLLRTNIDGIPLDLAAGLLPVRTKLNPGLLMHMHAHAASQKKHEDGGKPAKKTKVSQSSLLGIIESLQGVVRGLKWKQADTEWGDYYTNTNYSDDSLQQKKEIVGEFIAKAKPESVWDLGANNGFFSRVASDQGIYTIASDIDPVAVEHNYQTGAKNNEAAMLPLLMDLTNASPSLGWAHSERMSFLDRGPADLVISLALIHHLAISNNVPLAKLADFFHQAGKWVVMEFVPKSDSKVKHLLATREDVFPDYNIKGFEKAFKGFFSIIEKMEVPGSKRTMYLLQRK